MGNVNIFSSILSVGLESHQRYCAHNPISPKLPNIYTLFGLTRRQSSVECRLINYFPCNSIKIRYYATWIFVCHSQFFFNVMFIMFQRTPVSFYIENLEPGSSYRIILFAVNPKGRSEPTIIDDITFKGVAKYTGKHRVYVCSLLKIFFLSCTRLICTKTHV